MLLFILKQIFRGYFKNKIFTVLNLIGISVGLSVAYFAVSYLRFEFGFDKFHQKSDNIFRLANNYRNQGYSINIFPSSADDNPNGQKDWIQSLKATNGVADVAQFMVSTDKNFVENTTKRVETEAILTTNTPEAFVNIFSWEVLAGSFKNFHSGTNKVILTATVAERLSGKTDWEKLVNQTLKIAGTNMQVAAIIKDVPPNAHFDFEVAINAPRIDYWGSRVYVQTAPNVAVESVEKNLNRQIAAVNPRMAKDPLYKGHFLQPIGSIHLNSNILYESKPPGNYTYIFLIGLFAAFIVLITLFNYANLTLAIKSKQNKAIGVLKTMGAKGENIAFQFVLEAVLLSLLALPVACGLIMLVAPYFNQLMGVKIGDNLLQSYEMLGLLLGLSVGLGLVASIAPVVILAGKQIVLLFKNGLQASNFQKLSIRKYLIVGQFIFLISIASISYFTSQQMDFINQKELGFTKKQVLYVYSSPEKQALFQQKLRNIAEVSHVGNGSDVGIQPFNQMTYKLENQATVFDDARQLYLDAEALKAYQIKTDLKFDKNSPRKTIINRTSAQKLAAAANIPVAQLVGKTIITEPEYVNPANGQAGISMVIDGIFEDIHLFSLRQKIEPYFIVLSNAVRMDGRSIVSYTSPRAIAKIEAAYKGLNEPYPLEIAFLEDNLTKLYEQENRLNLLFRWFSVVALLLACLGIVGITLFLTRIRIKEIGIRKILGASPVSIWFLSIKEYLPLSLIAVLVSFPIVYFVMDQWLSGFAYRAVIQYLMVLPISILLSILVMLLIGAIAYKAALMNPVESLKTE